MVFKLKTAPTSGLYNLYCTATAVDAVDCCSHWSYELGMHRWFSLSRGLSDLLLHFDEFTEVDVYYFCMGQNIKSLAACILSMCLSFSLSVPLSLYTCVILLMLLVHKATVSAISLVIPVSTPKARALATTPLSQCPYTSSVAVAIWP